MTAALDAIARLDDGLELPGDRELADIFDRHCGWEADRLDAVHREQALDAAPAERADVR